MIDEGEVMLRVAERQKDYVFSLRFVLRGNNGIWNNLFMTLKLVKKKERSVTSYDYCDYALGERFLIDRYSPNTDTSSLSDHLTYAITVI